MVILFLLSEDISVFEFCDRIDQVVIILIIFKPFSAFHNFSAMNMIVLVFLLVLKRKHIEVIIAMNLHKRIFVVSDHKVIFIQTRYINDLCVPLEIQLLLDHLSFFFVHAGLIYLGVSVDIFERKNPRFVDIERLRLRFDFVLWVVSEVIIVVLAWSWGFYGSLALHKFNLNS